MAAVLVELERLAARPPHIVDLKPARDERSRARNQLQKLLPGQQHACKVFRTAHDNLPEGWAIASCPNGCSSNGGRFNLRIKLAGDKVARVAV